jgi:hypothetical protein
MSIGELPDRKDEMFKHFDDDFIFVRPDSGQKCFTGKAMCKDEFDQDYKLFTFYDEVTPDIPIIVAEAVNLQKEWRFVVADGKIITGSTYRVSGSHALLKTNDGPAFEYAQSVVDEASFNPTRVWVIDICERKNGDLFVLEMGGFSSCGLYGCDMEIVVREVSAIALDEWGKERKNP